MDEQKVPDSIEELTVEKIVKEFLQSSYELVYVDYRDSLNGDEEKIQRAIQEQEWYPLDDVIDEWSTECAWNSLDYIFKELKDSLMDSYDLSEDEIDVFLDEHRDVLEDEIYNRDKSTPLSDLMRNTDDPVMFYDLGTYLESSVYFDDEDRDESLALIKSVLAIDTDKFDRQLEIMLFQASYGGRLVIYFRHEIEPLIQLNGANVIEFENPAVAIIDTYNGSGDHTVLEGHKFSVPFDPTNLFLDKTIKYNYTYAVCGMYSNWCESTNVQFLKVEDSAPVVKSSLHAEMEVEAEYKKAFEAGDCTFGDMDINRHRGTFYKNEFPCGTHCPHCDTFWID